MTHRPARLRATVALTAAAVVTSLVSVTGPARADDTAVPPALDPVVEPVADAVVDTVDAARQALAAVADAEEISDGVQRGDLTMALREVANTRDALSGAERRRADAILARPTASAGDGTLEYRVPEATPVCSADICVHYVRTTSDAPSLADADSDGVPDYVQTALDVLTHVHDSYLEAGYREPKPDGTRGGNSKIDVYLGDLGSRGIYGYCTSDDPTPISAPYTDRWAYCALDNDFARDEFPTNTPLENLQVTVAHEYFHATQYAYDRYEDAWFLEATATWAEDEMYDGVNDNVQYLRAGPMSKPRTPMDTFGGGYHYGTWIFFRYLTERYRAKVGPLPRLVLDMWRKADGARGKPNQYSWQAVNTVLRSKKTTAARMFSAFAVANRRPARVYSEARANRYPVAPLASRGSVSPRSGVRRQFKPSHLSAVTTRLTPSGLKARDWKLRLTLDLSPRYRGGMVMLTTATRGGAITTQRVGLDRQGRAVKRIPFSGTRVAWVEVTLVNASGRFRCFRSNGFYSCYGVPKDDRVPMSFNAVAVR